MTKFVNSIYRMPGPDAEFSVLQRLNANILPTWKMNGDGENGTLTL